jgi:cell division septation protein DedD
MSGTELRVERDERHDSREEEKRPRRSPFVTGGIAIAAVAVFAMAIGYAYHRGRDTNTSGAVPIITADPGPFKVKPENPGGMNVPNRDLEIYKRMENAQPPAAPRRETLLPPPEKPIVPPRAEPLLEAPAVIATPKVIPPAAPFEPAPGTAKSIAEATAAKQAALPAAPKQGQGPAKPESTAKLEVQPNAAAAEKVNRIAPAAGGAFRIQLGALRTPDAARGAWTKLQKQHSDLLGSLALSIDRRDAGGDKGVFYRMQAGPLASESDARGLCTRLKQRHVDCLVVSL